MPIQNWRLLQNSAADGATNMAIDEAILTAHAQGLVPPTLRFYSWNPPCLSIGVFQSVEREIDLAECRRLGIDVVRRATGGRAVLHSTEVTYSLTTSAGHAFAVGNVRESYRTISLALAAGLRALGLDVQMAPRLTRSNATTGKTDPWMKTPACFDLPSDFEITVANRKLVGSAQLRRGDAILQHGSILLDVDQSAVLAGLRLRAEITRDFLAGRLATRMIGLREALSREVPFSEVVEAVIRGFQETCPMALIPGVLSDEELRLASRLREEKYASEGWNHRR